ncbi:MAG: putative ABC transporter permease subunit, partial [Candidatus Hydrogenedens sp.]
TSRVQSPIFPPYWFSEGVLKSKDGLFSEVLFWFLLLMSNALFFTFLSSLIAQWIFYPGFSGLQGSGQRRVKLPNKGILGRLESFLNFIPYPYKPLVVKDIRMFWRDATQWSQFIIFFGIMAIYIANLRNTTKYFEQEMWRSFVACMNIASLSLILATLTSRFIFPLISLEGHRFWIIGLAPITLRQILWQKFWLSVMTSAPFTVTLAILSGYMLQLAPLYYAMTIFSILLMNFGLSGLAVGLGALYPSFEEDNPARIVSGLGGTLNLLLSIFYIAIVVTAQTIILQWRVLEQFTSPGYFWFALVFVIILIVTLTGITIALPMSLGLKNLKSLEY